MNVRVAVDIRIRRMAEHMQLFDYEVALVKKGGPIWISLRHQMCIQKSGERGMVQHGHHTCSFHAHFGGVEEDLGVKMLVLVGVELRMDEPVMLRRLCNYSWDLLVRLIPKAPADGSS